jgi:hypothetical protein
MLYIEIRCAHYMLRSVEVHLPKLASILKKQANLRFDLAETPQYLVGNCRSMTVCTREL